MEFGIGVVLYYDHQGESQFIKKLAICMALTCILITVQLFVDID